jgi:hypothetical protein
MLTSRLRRIFACVAAFGPEVLNVRARDRLAGEPAADREARHPQPESENARASSMCPAE